VVVVVLVPLVVLDREVQDQNDNNGRGNLLGPFPKEPGVRIEPEHEPKVLQELVNTVDPGHDRDLQAAEDEG